MRKDRKMMKTILIIEDDENLSRGIAFAFENDKFGVVTATSMADGQAAWNTGNIDLIILDLGLPDGNGLTLCRKIREISDIPIVILTAQDLETDEVSGLQSGADDYITKPFSLSVLKARVDNLFRRIDKVNRCGMELGKYRLDTALCKLYVSEMEVSVSATEFRLLHYFMQNAGQILTKKQLLAALWDNDGNFVDENTLSVNISRLRSKIETDPKKPQTLKTVHGLGYVWIKG